MGLFGLPKQKKALLDAEMAASTLAACVMTDQDNKGMPNLDDEHARALATLIHLTNAAIVTNWLKQLAKSSNASEQLRANAILKEFELITYSGAPRDEAQMLARELQRLIAQTTDLIDIFQTKSMSQTENARRMLGWSKDWLSPIFEDDAQLKRASLLYGPVLMAQVHGAVQVLGKSVEMVMFGDDLNE